MKSLKEWKAERLVKKLGKALLKGEYKAIEKALDAGATRVDLTKGFQTGYGRVEGRRYTNPIEAARDMGLDANCVTLLETRLVGQSHAPSEDLLNPTPTTVERRAIKGP